MGCYLASGNVVGRFVDALAGSIALRIFDGIVVGLVASIHNSFGTAQVFARDLLMDLSLVHLARAAACTCYWGVRV